MPLKPATTTAAYGEGHRFADELSEDTQVCLIAPGNYQAGIDLSSIVIVTRFYAALK